VPSDDLKIINNAIKEYIETYKGLVLNKD
jgi:hypothetical protein